MLRVSTHRAARLGRVRWYIFAFLVAFGFIAYLQRTGITVVSKGIMAETGISQIQIGWALTTFLVAYTVLQLPGGLFGEWAGARRALTMISLLAVASTVAIAASPMAFGHGAALTAILCSCLVLGVAQAPFFPVASGAIEAWFPIGNWGTPQGVLTAGVQLGSAAAAPLTAWLVETLGWKLALTLPSIPALVLTALWYWYGRDRPAQHPAVSTAELAELSVDAPRVDERPVSLKAGLGVLRDRNILLLSASYGCMNYVFFLISFWCFLYLVEQRHFSILEGGWLASLPYLGAAVGGAVGGIACDRLCARWGARAGYRILPFFSLPVAALFLLWAVKSANGYIAVCALSFAFLSIELTEGSFLAAATAIGREHTMAATAVVNTGGNIGGIIATPIVAALSVSHGWTSAFVTGCAFALTSAALWIWIDGSEPLRTVGASPKPWTGAQEAA